MMNYTPHWTNAVDGSRLCTTSTRQKVLSDQLCASRIHILHPIFTPTPPHQVCLRLSFFSSILWCNDAGFDLLCASSLFWPDASSANESMPRLKKKEILQKPGPSYPLQLSKTLSESSISTLARLQFLGTMLLQRFHDTNGQ
jgi:hypothetical protein